MINLCPSLCRGQGGITSQIYVLLLGKYWEAESFSHIFIFSIDLAINLYCSHCSHINFPFDLHNKFVELEMQWHYSCFIDEETVPQKWNGLLNLFHFLESCILSFREIHPCPGCPVLPLQCNSRIITLEWWGHWHGKGRLHEVFALVPTS